MPYKFLEHTADTRLLVSGKSLEDLFISAFQGMVDILSPSREGKNSKVRRGIKIESADETSLLIDFLNEALFLMETNRECYEKIKINKLTPKKIEAKLEGSAVKKFGGDIKAVTHHEADIRKNEKGFFETKIIFDI